MEEELKQLKSVLRSLVVSSPAKVDVRSLLRDYRNMVGAHVPVSKFGYKDPTIFLKERCSDCFLGPAANPELTLIVPDALKHVDKFVQKQKSSPITKNKGKRRSIAESIVKPSRDLVVITYANKQDVLKKEPIFITNVTTSNSKNYHVSVSPEIKNHSQDSITPVFKKKDTNVVISKHGLSSSNGLQNFCKKKMPQYQSQYIESARTVDDVDSVKDDDSGRQTSSSTTDSSKKTQLEDLKKKIRELIVEHPDGVWCTGLLRLYRERYGHELHFSRFGYTSVLSLACALDDVSAVRHPAAGDWLLSDARRAPAARPLAPPRAPPRAPPPADPDDALPGVAFEADVFPEDCMHFLESIPAASLCGVGKGAMLEVTVAEVYSPSHFWLQRLGERHNIAMENMMDELNRYYASAEGAARVLAPGAVRAGHYCSSCYDGDWHRSLIVRVLDCDTVKVRHVDYGTVERCSVAGLRALPRKWARLEAQALRARLAGACPPAAGRRWPHAAAHHFLSLVRDKPLVANVAALDPEDDALEVFLIDTSTDEDLSITTEMLRSGHADPRADSALGTSECYLFPRFDALEAGHTPNFAEIHAYLRDGVALEFVEEYRRHVPPGLPPQRPEGASPAPTPASSSELAPARDVSLSASEVKAFTMLSRVSPAAAQRYMLETLRRALTPPLDSEESEFGQPLRPASAFRDD